MARRKKRNSPEPDAPNVEPAAREAPDGMITVQRTATLTVERADDNTDATVVVSVSSEEPCLCHRQYSGQHRMVWEILDHAPTSIDRTYIADGLVVRDEHYGDQISLIRACDTEAGKLGGAVDFCAGARAREIETDALNGLRRNMSVEAFIDPRSYTLEGERDGIPVVRASRWTPTGAAFISNPPADPTVGVARDADNAGAAIHPPNQPNIQTRSKTMPDEPKENTPVGVDVAAERDAATKARNDEVVRIYELASHLNMEADVVRAALIENKSLAECQDEWLKIVADRERDNKVTPREDVESGLLNERELKRYSILRAIRSVCPETPAAKRDCFELEISQHIAKATNKEAQGILVPWDALAANVQRKAIEVQRDLTVAGTGSNIVAEDLLAGSFIEVLASVTAAGQLGVQIMDGLIGDVAIPKQTAETTGYWVAEGVDITESQPTLAQVTGTPHTAGVMTDVTRKLIKQSAISVEQFVSREIMRQVGLTVDLAIIQGTGAAGQPSGLVNCSGVNTPTISSAGSPTWAETLTFLSMIMLDNAWFDAMKWAIRPNVFAKLAATTKDTGSGQFILNTNSKEIAGYPYVITNQTQADSAWFGDWSQVILGLWSAIDLTVDPYKHSASGGLRLVALQDCDVMCRHGQAFSYSASMAS